MTKVVSHMLGVCLLPEPSPGEGIVEGVSMAEVDESVALLESLKLGGIETVGVGMEGRVTVSATDVVSAIDVVSATDVVSEMTLVSTIDVSLMTVVSTTVVVSMSPPVKVGTA